MRIAASVGMAMLLAACSTTLERGLSAAQADEVVLALSEHGIGASTEAERAGSGFEVVVLEADVASALAVLRSEGLPRTDAPGSAEAFAEPSLVPTAGEERARIAAAAAADLARAIETLEGVHDARVHVGMPDPSVVPLDEAPSPVVASVLVRTRAGSRVDETAIRALVAGAVPGLAPERVTIVATPMPPVAAAAERLVFVGPIAVTESSATTLRAVLAVMLAVNVVLAAAIALVVRRRR